MCTFPSRGAILRRQRDPADIVRRLFGPKSRRNLSAASDLHADGKSIGGREGFLIWLKDIFNKAADRSHKADVAIVNRAATATTLEQPKIAVPKRSADSSSKVGAVNQELTNFGAAQSTTKFDGNFRVGKRNAEDGEYANVSQQFAIYVSSQLKSCIKVKKIFERETDSVSSRLDPSKIHRSARNDAIKFDDFNAIAYYRCYANQRRCYRLSPQTKQPLLRLYDSNRNIRVPTRTIADFAPRNPKPPIREPNAIEKREKEKDRREKKKPVIRTDGFVDNNENRTVMEADDNPKGDPDAVFRYEWGVKFAEEPAAETSDNDNFAEKERRYVTKRLWGVSLKQLEPDVEDTASLTSESPGRGASKRRNASSTIKTDETKSNVFSVKEPNASNLTKTIAEYLSTPSSNLVSPNLIAAEQETIDAIPPISSEALRKIIRTSPDTLEDIIAVDEEYNVPEGASPDAEIAAWKNLLMKWKSIVVSEKQDFLSTDYVENLKKVSIPPEAPQPKLDVRVVRSIGDNTKEKEIDQFDSAKSTEIERSGFMDVQKLDGYSSSRKMHTLNTQIRYAHRNMNCFIIRRYIKMLPSVSSIERTIQTKCPALTSAFSTNSENSIQKNITNKTSDQSEKQIDSKSREKKSDTTTNSLNVTGSLLSKKFQTFSNINLKQSYVDSHSVKIQSRNHEKAVCLSNSVPLQSVQKDESHFNNKNVQDKTKNTEDSHTNLRDESATYAFDAPSTDNNSIKSHAAKDEEDSKSNSKNEEDTAFDSDVEDLDNLSKDYIIDGDYVRLPGDPYPYSKEYLDKWRVPHSRSLVYKPIKRKTSRSDSSSVARSSLRNVNDSYANAAAMPRDSHAGTVIETSGSDDSAKNAGRASGFHMSSRDQRVASDCLRVDDAADALGLRQWTEAFSRLGAADERSRQTARDGDDVSLYAYHQ